MKTLEILKKFNACEDSIDFAGNLQPLEAWEKCERGDWMLWIAFKIGVDHRKLTLAKALCAKTVLHLMKDERSKKAVEIAEKYGNGEATEKDLKAAAAAAYAAYDAAYDAAAAHAADAAAAADAYAAAKENRMQTANICREILTEEILKAWENANK